VPIARRHVDLAAFETCTILGELDREQAMLGKGRIRIALARREMQRHENAGRIVRRQRAQDRSQRLHAAARPAQEHDVVMMWLDCLRQSSNAHPGPASRGVKPFSARNCAGRAGVGHCDALGSSGAQRGGHTCGTCTRTLLNGRMCRRESRHAGPCSTAP
jgi:hypothetical protein